MRGQLSACVVVTSSSPLYASTSSSVVAYTSALSLAADAASQDVVFGTPSRIAVRGGHVRSTRSRWPPHRGDEDEWHRYRRPRRGSTMGSAAANIGGHDKRHAGRVFRLDLEAGNERRERATRLAPLANRRTPHWGRRPCSRRSRACPAHPPATARHFSAGGTVVHHDFPLGRARGGKHGVTPSGPGSPCSSRPWRSCRRRTCTCGCTGRRGRSPRS
jgi:hypothetical protein